MGCVSSKEVKDASVAGSNPSPAGDHGSLVDDEAREKSSASFTAPSSVSGDSRPVPQARRFLDDGPSTSSGLPPASRRSAPSVSAGGLGDAPLDSDDELDGEDDEFVSVVATTSRSRGETTDEKKARKAAVKASRAAARDRKRQTKELFKDAQRKRSGVGVAPNGGVAAGTTTLKM